MNQRQKEVQQLFLDNEKAVLKELERNYRDALAEINGKIEVLAARNDADLAHVIYRIEHQKALRAQIEAVLESLHTNEFETVSEFLALSYEDGFVGTMYDMHGQGVPLVLPIDQKQVIEAIQHETKLKARLYTEMGHDIKKLQEKIAEEISRGISTGQSTGEMARNIADYAKIPKNRAMTIARTESHRIQCHATSDAQHKAKEKGADVLKQWDAALDGDTRDTHRQLDGQIRELDEPFEVAGQTAMFPGDFGDPAEDCNCRCALLQRARWALGKEELDTLKERAKYFGLDKTKDFEDFKEKYMQASERVLEGAQKKPDLSYQGTNGVSDKARYTEITADKVDLSGVSKNALEDKLATEAIEQINKVANNPKAKVTIYRATIGDTINEGDWVFLSEANAERWTKTPMGRPKPNVKVVKMVVDADDIQFQKKNLEFGYFPKKSKRKTK